MNVYLGLFVLFLINLITSNAYVLVQVQKKDDNLSNVDAIIHKTVPSDKVNQLTKKINRKKFVPEAKPKPAESVRSNDNINRKSNYVSVINDEHDTKGSLGDFASVIEMLLGNLASFTQKEMKNNPILSIKGKPINFRSGQKGAMMYELNSDHIIASLNNVLSSKPMKRLVEAFSKQAANLVRRLQDMQKKNDRVNE